MSLRYVNILLKPFPGKQAVDVINSYRYCRSRDSISTNDGAVLLTMISQLITWVLWRCRSTC